MAASTLADVAKLAGVSLATASRVLNGSTRTPGAAVTKRVQGAALELGYVANAQAQSLARSSTGLIGLVVHDIADPYFSTLARGVQKQAKSAGKMVLLASTDGSPSDEREAVAAFAARRAEAIVIAGSRSHLPGAEKDNSLLAAEIERYCNYGGSVSMVGAALPALLDVAGVRVLKVPNVEQAYALGQALLGLGYKRFLVVAGPDGLVTSDVRLAGFQSALADAGRAAAEVVRVEFSRAGGYAAGLSIAAQLGERSAAEAISEKCIFAVNDVMAMGVIAGLLERGLQVPHHIGVAGFDDVETLRDFRPSLTTAQLPVEEIGLRASALALGMDDDDPLADVVGRVMLRGSTRGVDSAHVG
ncbi:LacI family DNA-binding transcriptional regulator [Pseudarthrobacter sp. J1738]|uniref:LacI family DNA-binding transcriptional regulator n=1 Tax=Pseudarthrobacter sp. J1738 TaxID=3420446 RepID=UPI003D28F1B9